MHFTLNPLALGALAALFASATAIPNGKCHVGAAWPDWHDCHKFYECAAGGIPVQKSCGPGTAYAREFGICDYEWKVEACQWGKEHEKGEWKEEKGEEKSEHREWKSEGEGESESESEGKGENREWKTEGEDEEGKGEAEGAERQ